MRGFDLWLARRRPLTAGPFRLNRRRLYILPTADGLLYFLVLLLILIGAANYGSSLAFVLVFLLAGVGLNVIWLTHANLAGLELESRDGAPVFAGERGVFPLRCRNLSRRGQALLLYGRLLVAAGARQLLLNRLPPDAVSEVALAFTPVVRGWCRMPPLRLESSWPLGLFRVWTAFAGHGRLLVYPRPAPPGRPFPATAWRGAAARAAARKDGAGNEDFMGLRPYRPGDSPGRIDWRARARGGDLQSRLFQGGEAAAAYLLLDWDEVGEHDSERRLSQLCRWLLEAEALGLAYGLRLPGFSLGPGRGKAQRHQALRALALYGQGDG